MELGKAVEEVKSVAVRYGLKVETPGEVLIIKHPEAPITVELRVEEGRAVAELKVGSEIGEYIDSLLDEGEDPREAVEEAMEEMIRIIDFAASRLEREGIKVERKTREGILDAYDALEARLEEE
ncbi:hypothetical protein JCM10135_08160 [Stetteria hydrogenophila]